MNKQTLKETRASRPKHYQKYTQRSARGTPGLRALCAHRISPLTHTRAPEASPPLCKVQRASPHLPLPERRRLPATSQPPAAVGTVEKCPGTEESARPPQTLTALGVPPPSERTPSVPTPPTPPTPPPTPPPPLPSPPSPPLLTSSPEGLAPPLRRVRSPFPFVFARSPAPPSSSPGFWLGSGLG